ncbi:nuclear transport factor 2 family protein [Streptomyces sp. Ag109_O5-10]|uniref:nuclear transport factor 2 family protein n=1 Tax=Streptomyces sp. Ag109_O5-10 TaxID=1855349 RepID=UPI00089AD61D|nr:nuclear transport factor 2 family protein [Streptomyces sp. Ag109_O5-10]SED86117.1 SnoaL-like domain-containing protein [Streptomyces sp. Ag109_O5-10]
MDTWEAAERFVRVWARGWAAHDVDALLALYAEDCVHRSMPFRAPHRGRDELAAYLRWSFEAERVTDVRFSAPLVGPDGVAAAEFRVRSEERGAAAEFRVRSEERGAAAEFRVRSEERGAAATLAGCVFVRFDGRGLAVESRDYWHTADGHQEPAGRLFLL